MPTASRSAVNENYDYVHFVPAFQRMGHEVDFFDSGDRSLFGDFADLNRALLERVAGFRPDVIFCVLMHYEVWFETLDLIRANSPALVVNWGYRRFLEIFASLAVFRRTCRSPCHHRSRGGRGRAVARPRQCISLAMGSVGAGSCGAVFIANLSLRCELRRQHVRLSRRLDCGVCATAALRWPASATARTAASSLPPRFPGSIAARAFA